MLMLLSRHPPQASAGGNGPSAASTFQDAQAQFQACVSTSVTAVTSALRGPGGNGQDGSGGKGNGQSTRQLMQVPSPIGAGPPGAVASAARSLAAQLASATAAAVANCSTARAAQTASLPRPSCAGGACSQSPTQARCSLTRP